MVGMFCDVPGAGLDQSGSLGCDMASLTVFCLLCGSFTNKSDVFVRIPTISYDFLQLL